MAESSTTESVLRIRAENATGAALQQISRDLDTLGRQTARVGGQTASTATAIQRALGGLTGFQRQIGAAAISFGSGLVTRKSVVEFADLERSITSLHHTLGLGTDGLDNTRKKIFEVAIGTGQSADRVVKAYQTIAAAGGVTADETDNLVKMAAKASLAMDANIDDAAKMGVLWKLQGADMATVERMYARVTSASQKGRFEGKDFAANAEEIGLIMEQMGYKGEEGLNKVLAMLTQVRAHSASSGEAVTNLGDAVSKMMAPETFANFKKFGGSDLWNEQSARASRAAGKDLGMMFINASKLLIARTKLKGQPITTQDILADKQARIALASLTGDINGLKALFKEFQETDLTINDRQFDDKMKQARAAIDQFETKLLRLRTSLGKGLVDAGALAGVNWLADILERAGVGAERLGKAIKEWREGKGAGALIGEITSNMTAHKANQNRDAITDLRSRRAQATTPGQRADIDKMIDTLSDTLDRENQALGKGSEYPMQPPKELRSYGDPVVAPRPFTDPQSNRVRPSRNPNDPGTATEGTARESVDEQRKTRELMEMLIKPISLGGPGGGAGGGGNSLGGGAPGDVITPGGGGRSSYGGGRFNGLGGGGGVGGSMGGGIRARGARGGGGGAPDDGTPVAPFKRGTSGFEQKAPQVIGRLMKDFNLTQEQAAGIVGNLGHESEGLQAINERRPVVPGSRGGFGWAQWTGPRRRQFEAWAAKRGLDVKSDEANYGFLAHELRTTEKKSLDAVRGTKTARQAAGVFMETFERPGVKALGSRGTWADRAMRAGVKMPDVASGAPPAPEAAAQPQAAPDPVKVPVTFDYQGLNMPGIRDRGAAQARREMDREVRSARYTTYSDVGVA